VLIPFIGAPNVLYVDAATYAVAFLLVLLFVPKRKPLATAVRHGVLAGLRFLLGDRLLAPLAGVVVTFSFLGAGLSAGLPFYAFDEFDSPRIAGLFYAALGAGALVGSLVAILAVRRMTPLRLSGLAMLAFTVPLWVLPFIPPWPVVFVALFVATLFTPLVNGPLIAVLTARTPGELRAMVMTAVISVNTFLVAGQVLERWGVVPLFAVVVAGVTVMAAVYSAIVLRHRDVELPVAEATG
jgi:predicted MFS family arabinose efflux permease